ncbi:MAG: HAD family hydrolase [Methanocalculus sp. MSAO_Arc1]|uniref:HAD-IC family P-type ATPase n=1 Tax=Methanocalculus TaxID=71151 RepID=UPI000FF0275F|nr:MULTISPECIES: HAD-IC family P-type ATPase [unclassified Methanocalculus]MCP1662720.1 Cu+-exporting ATPase [Methanocalculus sp. AMF5]RQD79968.1 MAG: HAD family hydrolase [Methanocalculus sp. MSAO_Arc1]
MTIAIVFDSAGTLLRTYRVAKDIPAGNLIEDVESTTLTFDDADRILVLLHIRSEDVIKADGDMPLSAYLRQEAIDFGISCGRRVIAQEEVAEILYHDRDARVCDLQETIRHVWHRCSNIKPVMAINSGVILNVRTQSIEFTITAGGSPFPGAKETISRLHRMGVATFIASGDRGSKLEKIGDFLGIPHDRIFGVATPTMKAEIVRRLKENYGTVVMVGDGINDLRAMREADIAVLSEQQPGERIEALCNAADYTIHTIGEIIGIGEGLQRSDPGNAVHI